MNLSSKLFDSRAATALSTLLIILNFSHLRAAAEMIPMTPDHWAFAQGKVESVKLDGVQALKILSGAGQVVFKGGLVFTNGTIEYDFMPDRPDFVSLYLRRGDAAESEIVYFRTWNADKPTASGTLQYAPMVKGVNLWDLFGCYETACSIHSNQWNHVKLVVSGTQMRIFVNDNLHPVLQVPRLEANSWQGGFALEGMAYFANLKVHPDEVEGLESAEGIDPTQSDNRYLRRWHVTQPMALPPGRELFPGDFPKAGAEWTSIDAERRGLVNLSRPFGKSESRRAVWLKLKIRAEQETKRRMDLGISDEVWIFLNGGIAYTDKNRFGQPIMKKPNGRCSIENASLELAFRKGDNELLVGVANDFYGWGIVARLESLDGLEIVN